MEDVVRTCRKHGETAHRARKEGGFRCRKCNVEAVSARRRKVKDILVAEHGGKCIRCGYDKSPAALQFHHRDPAEKEFGISNGNTQGIDRIRKEAEKCDLICANCHAELHGE